MTLEQITTAVELTQASLANIAESSQGTVYETRFASFASLAPLFCTPVDEGLKYDPKRHATFWQTLENIFQTVEGITDHETPETPETPTTV